MDSISTEEQPVTTTEPSFIPPPPIPLQNIAITETQPYSDARPVWYVLLMYIATFSLYGIVWFYRAWNTLLIHYQLNGSALLNAIFSWFCARSFFKYASDFGREAGHVTAMPSFLIASIYFTLQLLNCGIKKLPEDKPWGLFYNQYGIFIVFFLITIPIREGVMAMNAGYALINPDKRMRTTLSPWAIVFLIIGSLLWILIIVNMVISDSIIE